MQQMLYLPAKSRQQYVQVVLVLLCTLDYEGHHQSKTIIY